MREFWRFEGLIGVIMFLCLWNSSFIMAENSIRIVSYNVENLFRTEDSIRHWTRSKYWNKIEKISRVIANLNKDGFSSDSVYFWQPPAIVGLQEIENDSCLIDLCRKMRNFHYSYVHYDSPDHRGIDVGLLYDTMQFRVLYSEPLRVPLDSLTTTRDILYVRGTIINPPFNEASPLSNDTLHLMVCHLPSMLGGRAESQWKRDSALSVIKRQIEKIGYSRNIVVMGDFNDDRTDIQGMYNAIQITGKKENKTGHIKTHKYQGIWAQLDYFWISEALKEKASAHIFDANWLLEEDVKYLDKRPKRTYNGWRYNPAGYSDHLPIYLDIILFPSMVNTQ